MPFLHYRDALRFSPERYVKNNFFAQPQMVGDVYCLEPGQTQRPHKHAAEAKLYYVIEGQGEFTVGQETRSLGPGDVACAAAGVEHGVANRSDRRLVALVVISPNPNLGKD